MAKAVSFTDGGGVRYPAPDVARGFMLILIALANVGIWSKVISTQVNSTSLDAIFTVLRVGLINQRAYPLFAMLFGFGLMTMVTRRKASEVNKACASLGTLNPPALPTGAANLSGTIDLSGTTDLSGAPNPSSSSVGTIAAQEESALHAATVNARKLLRRRGWWMLLFGGVHAMIFPGDIIGTYAIVALVFAGMLARERYRAMIVMGIVPFLAGLASVAFTPQAEGTEGFHLIVVSYWPWDLLRNCGLWSVATISGNFFTPIVMSAGIGAYLATTDIITHPERHRRLLAIGAVLGLTGAFLLGLPGGLFVAELVDWHPSWWIYVTALAGGPLGAWGWLSLLALFAGPAPTTGGLRGIRWVLCAAGRRSMTAYLLQSVSFLAIFVTVNVLGWPVSETGNVLFAWATWLLIAALCVALEYTGKRGPFEVLLRTAVASTARAKA